MVTADANSLVYFNYQIPRPIDAYLYAREIPTTSGYIPNLSYRYAVFWSNVTRATEQQAILKPTVLRFAYLELDLRQAFKKKGKCVAKVAPVSLEHVDLGLLRLAATRLLVSYYELDDPRLRSIQQKTETADICGNNLTVDSFNVYELRDVPQRIALAGTVHIVADEESVLNGMRGAEKAGAGANDVWVAADDVSHVDHESLQGTTGSVDVLTDAPDHLAVRVTTKSPGLLAIRDRYLASARATANGRPVQIVPVNFVFMGVPVPAGETLVDIRY